MKSAIFITLFACFSALAFSATIYVPDNHATIQGAIDAAAAGDEIIVRSGTYVENIDFAGKAITVKSELGAGVTTIDGNQSGSVVTFQLGEGADSVLDGFTITNGLRDVHPDNYGGGILCRDSSSPTIMNNIVTQNVADGGGGICCYSSSGPTIINNRVSNNTASGPFDGNGGGILCHDSSATTITDNIITENIARDGAGICCWISSDVVISNNKISLNTTDGTASYGGGIYCISSMVVIGENRIDANWASSGGGITCDNCDPRIENNFITNNTAWSGGGILCGYNSAPVIDGNLFSRNSATVHHGGGIKCGQSSSPPFIVNNAFYWNSALNRGGAIYCGSSSPRIVNNTMSQNSAEVGGAIACKNAQALIVNSIAWDNIAPIGPEFHNDFSTIVVKYSDVKGGWAGTGNIDADPLLVYGHLTINSPCRDSGSNAAPNLPDWDYDGDPRIENGTVDMGADEFAAHLFLAGDVIPGNTVELTVTGVPNQSVLLLQSTSIQDPPTYTQRGDWYLDQPLTSSVYLPPIRPNGFMDVTITVPATWSSGETYYFQALVGPWWGPNNTYTRLTNLMVLTVE